MDEIEQSLLGTLMLNPDALTEVSTKVSASDFLNGKLGRVFATLQAMADGGKPIDDVLAVRAELRASGMLTELGGDSFLAKLSQAPVTADSANYHAGKIRDASQMRKLAELGRLLVSGAESPHQKPQELARRTEARLAAISATEGTEAVIELARAVKTVVDGFGKIEPQQKPVPTGLATIDGALGGFFPGELVILAARPSIGKSALAAQMAVNAATEAGGVLFVSLEMTAQDIAVRKLAAALSVEVRAVRSGKVSRENIANAHQYAQELEGLPLHIHYGRACTVSKVRGLAKLVATYGKGLRLVMIDYLGLIGASDRRKPRWERMSEISADLKSMAQELGVPVLACCQLNRDAEGKPPTLAQLRDSGAIEQDADVVLLLHRESRDATTAVIDVAKCRNGSTGEIRLMFDPGTTTFSDQQYDFE